MEYQEIIHTIESKRRFGSLPGVEISRKLLAAAGDPQKDLAFVHIAGTNGKGSVAAFLHAVLKEAGIKTGLFTSPHLVDFRERIRINGEWIPRQDAARLGQQLLDMDVGTGPTMFDYCFVMALLYFKEQGCDLVILETGLGGRLDATNAIDVPLVSIITRIGYDHTAVLGETLPEIASEKAGILKKGTRAVLGCQKPEAIAVLRQYCSRLAIPVQEVDAARILPSEGGFSYPGEQPYQVSMPGSFQYENAMCAILAAKELGRLGYPVTQEALHRGIAAAVWEGRMEIVCEKPFLLIDGAHNTDGVAALMHSLKELCPDGRFHFIIGVLADKDYRSMVELALPLAARVTAVTPESGRALAGEELAAYIRKRGIRADSCGSVKEALEMLKIGKEEDAGIKNVAFGSLYFIGEIKRELATSFIPHCISPQSVNICSTISHTVREGFSL